MNGQETFTLIAAPIVVVGGFVSMLIAARRRRTFTHDGQTYTRARNGSFLDSAGLPVASAALIGALAVAHEAHVQKLRAASGSGGDGGVDSSGSSDGGGWFGSGHSGSWFSGNSSDGGGGGEGGSD